MFVQTGFLPVEDPRSPLQKARRRELLAFARANGVTEIKHDMPAPLMRKILALKGLTNIKPTTQPLGYSGTPAPVGPSVLGRGTVHNAVPERGQAVVEPAVAEIDADAELEAAYRSMQQPAAIEEAPAEKPKRGRKKKTAE